jgi:hypothetical protein
MLKRDLARARAIWIAKATDPASRQRRVESSFLSPIDSAGRVVDFHALRHGFVTPW